MDEEMLYSVSRAVGPDDIAPGDYVAVLHEVREWVPSSPFGEPTAEVLRAGFLPEGTRPPVRVVAVCVPFVFVEEPGGRGFVLDVRQYRLARLDGVFGRAVFEAVAAQAPSLRDGG